MIFLQQPEGQRLWTILFSQILQIASKISNTSQTFL